MKFLKVCAFSFIIALSVFAESATESSVKYVAENKPENFTIYLVRHAEKQSASSDKKDPSLTSCGQYRAKQLASLLSDIPLAAVYSTPYKRTLETSAPTAKLQQIPVKHYSPKSLQQLAFRLKQQQQNVLVVGHSNTTVKLAGLLGNEVLAPLTELDYQKLYQVQFIGSEVVINLLTQPLVCRTKD